MMNIPSFHGREGIGYLSSGGLMKWPLYLALSVFPLSWFTTQECTCSTENDADGDEWTVCDGDCDDADAAVFPGAAEQCNSKDDDCNGKIDEVCWDTALWDDGVWAP